MSFYLSATTLGATSILAMTFVAVGDGPTASPVNETCPVMPEEPVDPKYTLDFEGRTIGFCCEKCVAKFQANPDRYRARLPELASRNDESDDRSTPGKPPAEGAGINPARGWVPLLGRYHPVFVHFPIAGAPLALLGLCCWLATRNQAFAAADAPPLLLAAAFSIVAVVTGNIAEETDSFSPSLQKYLLWHEYAGTTLMSLLVALGVIRIWRWRRFSGVWLRLYACGLVLATLVAGISGFLGGTLVFGTDHLWP